MEDYIIKAGPALFGVTAERYLAMLYTLGHSPPRCEESVQTACNLIIRYLQKYNYSFQNLTNLYSGIAPN
jgi:hypothetical protein